MKVLNLQCSLGHGFEGWFSSEDDFQAQLAGHLLECPVCGDAQILKLPSAPRLNVSRQAQAQAQALEATPEVGAAAEPLPAVAGEAPRDALLKALPAELQERFMNAVREVMANTEDVGHQFGEEARKMHYGETEVRNIRGVTSLDEARELLEEGIDVLPLPIPAALKGPLQ